MVSCNCSIGSQYNSGWKGPKEVTKSSLWHVSTAVFASTRTALKENYVIAVVQNCLLDLLHAKFFPNIRPEALSGSGCTNTQNRASTLLCYFKVSQARKLRVLRVDHGIDSHKTCTVQTFTGGSLHHFLVQKKIKDKADNLGSLFLYLIRNIFLISHIKFFMLQIKLIFLCYKSKHEEQLIFLFFCNNVQCHKEGYQAFYHEVYRQISVYWRSLCCFIEPGSIWVYIYEERMKRRGVDVSWRDQSEAEYRHHKKQKGYIGLRREKGVRLLIKSQLKRWGNLFCSFEV